MTIVQTQGMSVADAKELVIALVRPELERLSQAAAKVACARVDEFVTEILMPKILAAGRERLASFEDPDVQYALLSAQRTYARTGDPDVADVLVDILIDRTAETTRNVKQLALNEALDVTSKLTSGQFAVLSLVWLLKYTQNSGIQNQDDLKDYIEQYLAPHLDKIETSRANFQHLEFAGCGAVSLATISIEEIFRVSYSGLFARGFAADELTTRFETRPARLDELIMPCLNDPQKLQINALNEDALRSKSVTCQLSDEQTDILLAIFNEFRMDPEMVKKQLIELQPKTMGHLIEAWNESEIKNLTLTSVGIVIAHANCRRVTGETPGDLSIWLE